MRAHALDDRHAENQQPERHREATTHQHVAEHSRRHVPELRQPTPYGDRLERGAAKSRTRKPANAERGHTCRKFLSRWIEPANPNRNPIEHPSTMSPASNTSKEALPHGAVPRARRCGNALVPGMGAGRGRLVTGMHCICLHVFDFAWPAAMVGSQELPVPRRCWSIWGLVVFGK